MRNCRQNMQINNHLAEISVHTSLSSSHAFCQTHTLMSSWMDRKMSKLIYCFIKHQFWHFPRIGSCATKSQNAGKRRISNPKFYSLYRTMPHFATLTHRLTHSPDIQICLTGARYTDREILEHVYFGTCFWPSQCNNGQQRWKCRLATRNHFKQ